MTGPAEESELAGLAARLNVDRVALLSLAPIGGGLAWSWTIFDRPLRSAVHCPDHGHVRLRPRRASTDRRLREHLRAIRQLSRQALLLGSQREDWHQAHAHVATIVGMKEVLHPDGPTLVVLRGSDNLAYLQAERLAIHGIGIEPVIEGRVQVEHIHKSRASAASCWAASHPISLDKVGLFLDVPVSAYVGPDGARSLLPPDAEAGSAGIAAWKRWEDRVLHPFLEPLIAAAEQIGTPWEAWSDPENRFPGHGPGSAASVDRAWSIVAADLPTVNASSLLDRLGPAARRHGHGVDLLICRSVELSRELRKRAPWLHVRALPHGVTPAHALALAFELVTGRNASRRYPHIPRPAPAPYHRLRGSAFAAYSWADGTPDWAGPTRTGPLGVREVAP